MLKFGLISDIDPSKGLARVNFDDDGIVSAWLPIIFPKAMADSFIWLPDINEHVACLMDAHAENGVIIGSVYSAATAPNGGNKDKFRATFSDGTVIEYDRAAHKLTANVQGSVDVEATGNAKLKATHVTLDAPNVTVTGVLSAGQISTASGSAGGDGSVSIQGDLTVTGGDVVADLISLKLHKHIGVQPGAGISGTPTP